MTRATNYFIGALALAVAASGCGHAEPVAEAGALDLDRRER